MNGKRVIIVILAVVIVSTVSTGAFTIYKNIDKKQSDNSLKLSDIYSILTVTKPFESRFKDTSVSGFYSHAIIAKQPFKKLKVSDVDSIMVYEYWTEIAHVLSYESVAEIVDILSKMKISILPVKDEDAVMLAGRETKFSMLLKDGRMFEFVECGLYCVLNNKRYETDESVLLKIAAVCRKEASYHH